MRRLFTSPVVHCIPCRAPRPSCPAWRWRPRRASKWWTWRRRRVRCSRAGAMQWCDQSLGLAGLNDCMLRASGSPASWLVMSHQPSRPPTLPPAPRRQDHLPGGPDAQHWHGLRQRGGERGGGSMGTCGCLHGHIIPACAAAWRWHALAGFRPTLGHDSCSLITDQQGPAEELDRQPAAHGRHQHGWAAGAGLAVVKPQALVGRERSKVTRTCCTTHACTPACMRPHLQPAASSSSAIIHHCLPPPRSGVQLRRPGAATRAGGAQRGPRAAGRALLRYRRHLQGPLGQGGRCGRWPWGPLKGGGGLGLWSWGDKLAKLKLICVC